MKPIQRRKQAFTLIELLVVIAIIAILAAILFPVFAKARAKARQASCQSNEKQILMGIMQYTQDYDEYLPLLRNVGIGQRCKSTEMSWKDLCDPYVKSGGRAYNNGVAYTTPGPGGVYQCSDNDAAWTNVPGWGSDGSGPGDETSRFPKSYSANTHAGSNEGVTVWADSNNTNRSSTAGLQTPANTMIVVETRYVYVDANVQTMVNSCNSAGQPWGGTGISCVKAHTGGFIGCAFADGHVKAVTASQTVNGDAWDCFNVSGCGVGKDWVIKGINDSDELSGRR